MGLALEKLSSEQLKTIALEIFSDFKEYRNSLTKSCPFHSEKTIGAFFYNYEKDFYNCFSCGASGDIINLYAHNLGRNIKDKESFIEFKKKYLPDDNYQQNKKKVYGYSEPVFKTNNKFKGGEIRKPKEIWQQRAQLFVKHSIERLENNKKQLLLLKQWGFKSLTDIKAFKIGYNERFKSFEAKAWGVKGKIYLPQGLVFPYFIGAELIRIKIRQEKISKKYPRYLFVEGSGNELYFCNGNNNKYIIVVEAERDAAMLWSLSPFRDYSVLALGAVTNRPCEKIDKILKKAEIVLIALDNDEAGFKNYYRFWFKNYPKAKLWPIPKTWGKDPGEAAINGHDLNLWIRAGLD